MSLPTFDPHQIKPAFEYYLLPFARWHQRLSGGFSELRSLHPLRRQFWASLSVGTCLASDADKLLSQYSALVEREMHQVIETHSIGYWLHFYRRVRPGAINTSDPATVYWIRASMEAAFQKQASANDLGDIGDSSTTAAADILDGFYAEPEHAHMYELIKTRPQLVLKHVSIDNFRQLYDLERLSFEVWKTMATRRAIGKGAHLVITGDSPYFGDKRTDDLDALIRNYDSRDSVLNHSLTGATFELSRKEADTVGLAPLPQYNVNGVPFSRAARAFGYKEILVYGGISNFVWSPFFLRGFYEVHVPFAGAFQSLHGVSYTAVLTVIATLLAGCLQSLFRTDELHFWRYWQRAYEGPDDTTLLKAYLTQNLSAGVAILGIEPTVATSDLDQACAFLTRDEKRRKAIDIGLAGPMSILIPIDDTRLLVDYAWLSRILYTLFHGVVIPDQNFKGAALEAMVRRGASVIPHGVLVADDGSKKQIDAAFKSGGTLVIAECRAVGRSIAFDRGDRAAVDFRNTVLERTLRDIDEKAKWLRANPTGRNYDVRNFNRIIPVGVTPFVEFVPSRTEPYWLTREIPRILSPTELREHLKNGVFGGRVQNSISIVSDGHERRVGRT